MLRADGHHFFGAGFSADDPDVGGQDGGQRRVEFSGEGVDDIGQRVLHVLVELLEIEVLGVLFAEQGAAPQPGERNNLDDAVFGGNVVNLRFIGDDDIFHGQRIEDFGAGGASDSVGQVVVADEQEDGDTAAGKPVYPFGEFPLLGLAGFAAFIGVAGKQHQVDVVVQGVIDDLVEGRQNVVLAGGQACRRIDVAVAFNAEVEVGKMEDFQITFCPVSFS